MGKFDFEREFNKPVRKGKVRKPHARPTRIHNKSNKTKRGKSQFDIDIFEN